MTKRRAVRAETAVSRRARMALLVTGGVLAMAAAQAPAASAYIYWTNNGATTIGRASLDGTGANQSLISGGSSLFGIAVDAGHIYWANSNFNSIGRSNLDGTGVNQTFITTGANSPTGVAVDGAHIYWANYNDGTIWRANLDGTSPMALVTGASNPYGVAVDAAHIYWANGSGSIGRANLDGSSPNNIFIPTMSPPFGVAVDGAHIYWANGSNIGRANLDGTSPNQTFIVAASPADTVYGVAVDGAHIYWANSGSRYIGRANLDGSGVNQSFISVSNSPYGVAVDGLSTPLSTPPLTGITVPYLGPIKLSAVVFRAASSGPTIARARRPPVGTSVRYTDSAPSVTIFTVTQTQPGHKRGKKCVRGQGKGKGCTLTVTLGSFSHIDRAGPNSFRFTGRIRGHKLKPGRYSLVTVPVAGDRRGAKRTTSFKIVA